MDNTEQLERLIGSLNQKEKFTIYLNNCIINDNGEIPIKFYPEFIPKSKNSTYLISLLNFSASSLIPNLTEDKNKFYYSTTGSATVKIITIYPGFYDLDNYIKEIQNMITNNGDEPKNIEMSINSACGIFRIKLSNGYKVYSREDTWLNEELGFGIKDLTTNSTHQASKRTDIWNPRKIYITCNLCKGNKILCNGVTEETNVLYSFPYNFKPGSPITIMLDAKLTESELDLCTGKIIDGKISFYDNNNNPVTFGKDPVSLSLRIKQV